MIHLDKITKKMQQNINQTDFDFLIKSLEYYVLVFLDKEKPMLY